MIHITARRNGDEFHTAYPSEHRQAAETFIAQIRSDGWQVTVLETP